MSENIENEFEGANVPKKADNTKMKVSLIVATILAIALITFIAQNLNRTKVEFLGFDFQVRIIYLMLFSMIFGVVATYAFQKYRRSKKTKK